ncbi:MAG: hypothetical protein RKK11_01260 [Alphaproteobacteria bacterium]
MYERLKEARKAVNEGWPGGQVQYGMGYPVGVKFCGEDGQGWFVQDGITVQARHPRNAKGFLRFQWNPARFTKDAFSALSNTIDQHILPGWLASVRKEGAVTRIDTTTDILGLPLDDIMVHVDKKQSFAIFSGPGGRTETMYFGKGSSNQVQFYDRTVKKIAEGKGVNPIAKGKHWVRIEVRNKPGKSGTFPVADLPSLGNPFGPIRIYNPNWDHPDLQHPMFRLFASAWQVRGRKRAVELAGTEGKHLRALTEQCQAKWWNADAKWKYWLQALEKAGLLANGGTNGPQ